MPIIAVKNKFQVVIPQELREKVGISVGDLLEAKVERGKITFTPKALIDRELAEGLADFEHGRGYGPFKNAADAVAAMKAQLKKRTQGKRRAA